MFAESATRTLRNGKPPIDSHPYVVYLGTQYTTYARYMLAKNLFGCKFFVIAEESYNIRGVDASLLIRGNTQYEPILPTLAHGLPDLFFSDMTGYTARFGRLRRK